MLNKLVYLAGNRVCCPNPDCREIVCVIARDVYEDDPPTCQILTDWRRDDPIVSDSDPLRESQARCKFCGYFWLKVLVKDSQLHPGSKFAIFMHTVEWGWGLPPLYSLH